MPNRRKTDLAKIHASLNTVCPKCGKQITPAELQRVDFNHVKCPDCGEQFEPGPHTGGAWTAMNTSA